MAAEDLPETEAPLDMDQGQEDASALNESNEFSDLDGALEDALAFFTGQRSTETDQATVSAASYSSEPQDVAPDMSGVFSSYTSEEIDSIQPEHNLDEDPLAGIDLGLRAGDEVFTVLADGSITFKASDILGSSPGADEGKLSIAEIGGVEHGTLVSNGNASWTYTPDADWNGAEELSYTVTHEQGETALGAITLDVAALTESAAAVDVRVTGQEDVVLSGELAAIDLSGRDQTSPLSNTDTAPQTEPLQTDVEDVEAVNTAPIADENTNTGTIDAPLDGLLTATDLEEDDLVFSLDSQAENGTVDVNSDGTYTYTPNEGFTGTDQFTFQVKDEHGEVTLQDATVLIETDAPESEDDSTAEADKIAAVSGAADGVEDNALAGGAEAAAANDADDTSDDSDDTSEDTDDTSEDADNTSSDSDDALTDGETFEGTDGDDVLSGGSGNDILVGGRGNDHLSGGDGNDEFRYQVGDGNDHIDGDDGVDRLNLMGEDGESGGWTITWGDDGEVGEAYTADGELAWTITLDQGNVFKNDEGVYTSEAGLSDDASGMITFDDGTEVEFEDIDGFDFT